MAITPEELERLQANQAVLCENQLEDHASITQLQNQIQTLGNAMKYNNSYLCNKIKKQILPTITKNQSNINNINHQITNNNEEKYNKNDVQQMKDRILRNELLIDKMNVSKNSKNSKKYIDTNSVGGGIDWRSGGYFILKSIEDKMVMILRLINPNLKLTQLYVELNNLMLIENIQITFQDNCVNLYYRTILNPRNKLITFGLSSAIKDKNTFYDIKNVFNKYILSQNGLNKNLFLLAMLWKNNDKCWKTVMFTGTSTYPKPTFKAPVYMVLEARPQGLAIIHQNDKYKLFACGKFGLWKEPSNYYKNSVIPPPVKISHDLKINIIQCDIGFISHYIDSGVTEISVSNNINETNGYVGIHRGGSTFSQQRHTHPYVPYL
eukprot:175400_1